MRKVRKSKFNYLDENDDVLLMICQLENFIAHFVSLEGKFID
jgi:hypothetical protein